MKSGKILAYVLLCVFSLTTTLSAQIWPPSSPAEYHAGIVQVESSSGRGSGTVVKFIKDSTSHPEYYIGLILTASHVIHGSDDLYTINYRNGKKTVKNSAVVKYPRELDKYNDVGLIRALIPDEITPMEISSARPRAGEVVEVAGYGGGGMRHWQAVHGGTLLGSDGFIVLSWAIQGDSGGPVIYKGKVIGVICFGSPVNRYRGTRRLIVCPIHCSSVDRVKNFIKAYSA